MHGIVSNHGFVDGNKRTALYLVELLALEKPARVRGGGDRVVADHGPMKKLPYPVVYSGAPFIGYPMGVRFI